MILGVEFYVTGDNIRAEETSLIVVNHRTRVDWNFLWAAFFHGSVPTAGHNAKLVLKDEVKNLPGVGKDKVTRVICRKTLLSKLQYVTLSK